MLSCLLEIGFNIRNKGCGCDGLVRTPQWEFSNEAETLTIFRPWGFQPGHQVEWARLLITLNRYKVQIQKVLVHCLRLAISASISSCFPPFDQSRV